MNDHITYIRLLSVSMIDIKATYFLERLFTSPLLTFYLHLDLYIAPIPDVRVGLCHPVTIRYWPADKEIIVYDDAGCVFFDSGKCTPTSTPDYDPDNDEYTFGMPCVLA